MKKTLLVLAIAIIASSMLFANGASEASAAKSTVRVMVWSSTNDQKLVPNNIEAKFEEAFPQYDLEIETVEYESLDSQTLLSHQTGNDYDVIMVNHSSLPAFVAGGVVAPMDDIVANLDMEY